jgi:hypothetical protein
VLIKRQGGHLHDGGDSVNLYVNGKKECVSKAGYGGPGAIRVGNDGRKWETISSMTQCLTPIRVKKGDQVEVEAHYDINAHPL